MGVSMTCSMTLAFLAVSCITTSDAWLFKKEKPIDEYEFKDCEGKRYWTYNSICCEFTVHDRIFHDDECCGGYRYNRKFDLCCDGHPVPKEAQKKCPENFDEGVKMDRVSS